MGPRTVAHTAVGPTPPAAVGRLLHPAALLGQGGAQSRNALNTKPVAFCE
jgi:hypothetical protein